MKTRSGLLVACLCWAAVAQQPPTPPSGHVVNNVVFMTPGDKIGVNLAGAADGTPLRISEEADLKKANLVLGFRQEKAIMLFTIENRTEHWLTYEAGIRVPKRDGLYKTSVLPLGPRVSNSESWPFPIDQLAFTEPQFHREEARKQTDQEIAAVKWRINGQASDSAC